MAFLQELFHSISNAFIESLFLDFVPIVVSLWFQLVLCVCVTGFMRGAGCGMVLICFHIYGIDNALVYKRP